MWAQRVFCHPPIARQCATASRPARLLPQPPRTELCGHMRHLRSLHDFRQPPARVHLRRMQGGEWRCRGYGCAGCAGWRGGAGCHVWYGSAAIGSGLRAARRRFARDARTTGPRSWGRRGLPGGLSWPAPGPQSQSLPQPSCARCQTPRKTPPHPHPTCTPTPTPTRAGVCGVCGRLRGHAGGRRGRGRPHGSVRGRVPRLRHLVRRHGLRPRLSHETEEEPRSRAA